MSHEQHTITLTPPTQSSPDWLMSLDGGKAEGPGSYPTIIVGHGKQADLTFNIQNGPGQTITFANSPILVPPKVTDFKDISGAGTATLKLTDKNIAKADIPYALVFNGAQKLDPIIQNDGCCTFEFWSSTQTLTDSSGFTAWVAIAFLAGVLITLAIRKFR